MQARRGAHGADAILGDAVVPGRGSPGETTYQLLLLKRGGGVELCSTSTAVSTSSSLLVFSGNYSFIHAYLSECECNFFFLLRCELEVMSYSAPQQHNDNYSGVKDDTV